MLSISFYEANSTILVAFSFIMGPICRLLDEKWVECTMSKLVKFAIKWNKPDLWPSYNSKMLVAAICFKVEKSKNYFLTKMDEVDQQLYIINATKILNYYVLWLDSSSPGKYNEMRLAGGTYRKQLRRWV